MLRGMWKIRRYGSLTISTNTSSSVDRCILYSLQYTRILYFILFNEPGNIRFLIIKILST